MSCAEPFVALDLDGTLIDAQRRQVAVAEAVLDALGLTPLGGRGDAFWRAKREGLDTRRALESLGYPPEAAREAAARWGTAIEDPAWLALDAWLPGAEAALAHLRKAGIPTIVVTARRDAGAVAAQCQTLGLATSITALHVVDPTRAAKAKAQLLAGARVFIGDSESDADAARLAGVPFIGVTGGQRSAAFLAAHGVQHLCDGVLAAVLTSTRPDADTPKQTPDAALRPDGARDRT